MTKNTGKGNVPALIAYHVPDREKAKWQTFGAAWHHEDDNGFTLRLDLMPDQRGRIVRRKYKPTES